jgi:RNA polymerase sigma factor (sigma-70 family)
VYLLPWCDLFTAQDCPTHSVRRTPHAHIKRFTAGCRNRRRSSTKLNGINTIWTGHQVYAPRVTTRLTPEELEDLTLRARNGDELAWEGLVRGLAGAVYRSLHAFGLTEDARTELFQLTFVRLFEKLGTIEQPRALPAWLMTTAGNEARQFLRRSARTISVPDVEGEVDMTQLDEGLLSGEMKVAALRAFGRLPPRCQRLMRLLTLDPPMSYAAICDHLGLKLGDIGPTRGRCLEKLRRDPELAPFFDNAVDGRSG